MKLKKIVLLPLLLVALASCGNRNSSSQGSSNSNPPSQESSASTSTSQEESTSTSTVVETPVTPEAANARVAVAIEKVATEPLTSIDLSVTVDAFAQRKLALLDSGVITENDSVEVVANATVKAKDLDKGDAQFAITGSAEATLSMHEEAYAALEAEAGVYYVDNFIYLDLSLAERDLSSGQVFGNSQKQKMEVGPFPGLESILEELFTTTPLPEEFPEDVPVDLPEIELNLGELLANIGDIEATEINGVLTVKYEITIEDIYQLVFAMNQDAFADLPPEAYEDVLASIQEMVDDFLIIREAAITVTIAENDVLTGLAIDLDLDVMNQTFAWDETGEDLLDAIETTTIRGSVGISLKINEEVAISFPSFADFVLVDEEE